MARIRIGAREIGSGCPAYVIAEIGSNHDGEKARALSLIDRCADAGADAVKFQLFSGDGLVNPVLRADFHAVIEQLTLPREWLPELARRAAARHIDFLATPFDLPAVQTLAETGVPAMKIASSDLDNVPLLRACAATRKPILLSTGLAYLNEIESAVRFLRAEGAEEMAVLHCVAAYPTPEEHANLRVMARLRQTLDVPVGFSDHTLGCGAPVAAVALGASVVEKHVTYDRQADGPDHPFAVEMGEFARLVRLIRQAEASLGEDEKRLHEEEITDRDRARRGLFLCVDVRRGTRIDPRHLITLRPRKGLGAAAWDSVAGRVATRDLRRYEPLSSADFAESSP